MLFPRVTDFDGEAPNEYLTDSGFFPFEEQGERHREINIKACSASSGLDLRPLFYSSRLESSLQTAGFSI